MDNSSCYNLEPEIGQTFNGNGIQILKIEFEDIRKIFALETTTVNKLSTFRKQKLWFFQISEKKSLYSASSSAFPLKKKRFLSSSIISLAFV